MLVLIIGSVALMMVFEIGGRAAQTGFGLGGRALAVSDRQLAEDSLRTVIRGLSIAPLGEAAEDFGLADVIGTDAGFEGDAILDRAGLCGESGPVRRIIVSLDPANRLSCRTEAAGKVELLDLGRGHAHFAYSADGVHWQDRWSTASGYQPGPAKAAATLFIRLLGEDGSREIIGKATSGRPALFSTITTKNQGVGAAGL